MKRKDYQKPTMRVVKLQHQSHILSGSDVKSKASIKNWDDGGTTNDEVEM